MMLKKQNILWGSIFLFFSFPSYAIDLNQQNDIAQENIRQQQQRQEQLEKTIQPSRDVNLEQTVKIHKNSLVNIQDQTCFRIDQVDLVGEQHTVFQPFLTQALNSLDFKPGLCLGENRINALISQTQNLMIARGYTTTRILVAPQNLSQGQLKLTVIPGLIHQIRFDLSDTKQTHADRIQYADNIFPLKSGDILNLHALEQGLENLKRVPTVDADIDIVPATNAPNQSDVVVKWKQRTIPARITLSIDDAGSRQTGKYQGNVTLSLDNPLFRSDLFYITVGRDLGDQIKITDQYGHTVNSGTNNYALHYSVPYKNWLLSMNASRYQYDQAVAGTNNVYNYNGVSHNQDIGLTKLLHRDAKRKTSVTLKGWHRNSRSYIDDAELTIQRRDVAGWQLNIDHREYIKSAVLDVGVGYKRGTGALNALRAPEEAFNEGSSRMQILTFDLNSTIPFTLGQQRFQYASSFHGQYNQTPLTVQDRISIGGRYTVRGFDGDLTLAADRGYYWRNDIAMHTLPSHQFYVALDGGHVDGPSAQWLLGKTLVGTAIGFRGQFKLGGALNYDIYAGKPLYKPEYFQSYAVNYGFGLNYSF